MNRTMKMGGFKVGGMMGGRGMPTKCAEENQNCSCTGQVFYGAGDF